MYFRLVYIRLIGHLSCRYILSKLMNQNFQTFPLGEIYIHKKAVRVPTLSLSIALLILSSIVKCPARFIDLNFHEML